MKANVFGMLMKLSAICAVVNFVLLSAAEIPLSDKPSQDIEITPALASSSNETIANNETTIPPTNATENLSLEGSGEETSPPLVFPEENKLPSNNETLLKILQNSSSQGVKSTEETKLTNSSAIEGTDLTTQTSPSSSTSENVTNETFTNSSTTETPEQDYDSLDEETGKSDSENIQENFDEPQDELEEQFAKNGSDKATIKVFEDPTTNEPLHSGHVALIFASILVIFSVVAYIGLILWRSRLENLYGMRQRLVTEDVFYSDNQNDTRYFGL